jgi:hypothetical protein
MGEKFSTHYMLRFYNQNQLAVAVRELQGFICELLLTEAGSWGQGQFRNSEERECWKLQPSNNSEDMTVNTSVCDREL